MSVTALGLSPSAAAPNRAPIINLFVPVRFICKTFCTSAFGTCTAMQSVHSASVCCLSGCQRSTSQMGVKHQPFCQCQTSNLLMGRRVSNHQTFGTSGFQRVPRCRVYARLPLSSEHGTFIIVKARLWPWLPGKGP